MEIESDIFFTETGEYTILFNLLKKQKMLHRTASEGKAISSPGKPLAQLALRE